MASAATIDIALGDPGCWKDCPAFLDKYGTFWAEKRQHPVAILETTNRDGYFGLIDAKARNMVRKADKLYTYSEFDHNKRLDDLYKVNTSKLVRQGRPMSTSYMARPEPIRRPWLTCPKHRSAWYGGFNKEDRLVVYCNLIILGELGIVNRILGHADASAAMNGMISHLAEQAPVKYLHYLTIASSSEGLTAFKLSVGFKEVIVANHD